MTSLLDLTSRPSAAAPADPRHRRPLVAVALLGGLTAAASTLVVCLAIGVAGWFLTDLGSHGEPREGLRTGALGWLMAHGSGVHVQGVAVTVVPLLLTMGCGWATWRLGLRVGDSVSGHGPDADAISDGERDWTVPVAVCCFALGYLLVTVVTASLAGTPGTAPSTGRAVVWSLALVLGLGGPAIATGSGRAAIWAAFLPASVRAVWHTARTVVTFHLLAAAVALVVALALDLGTAANVLAQLRLDGSESALFLASSALLLPNAVVFSSAYLLGPGFAFGAGTMISPTIVTIGALPMFPLLAALPDNGPTQAWTAYLMAVPPLVAGLATARAHRRHPTIRWEEGALRGCTGGVLAGVAIGALAALSGGSVGPGRMQQVEPFAFDVLVHAITAFGIGGLLGGLVMTWWQRRALRAAAGGTTSGS